VRAAIHAARTEWPVKPVPPFVPGHEGVTTYKAVSGMPLPTVRLRAFTSADAPVVRRWESAPERFLRVADLLASAEVPGTVTLLAEDADGRAVAVFQSAPEGSERAGMCSVALLVHPGRRRAGFGRAVLLAALDESRYAGSVLLAVIDRENAASLRCFAACGFAADDDAASGNYAELVCRVPASVATTQPRRARARFSAGSLTVDRAGRRRPRCELPADGRAEGTRRRRRRRRRRHGRRRRCVREP
jgi:L-amino acid N-acyltransferase YncA